ncbi:MAG TPA: hypothetical protein VK255_01055 [Patescibacteria group bacterium]|nr:hypothetical protein [Patescibacteria group bacterium]
MKKNITVATLLFALAFGFGVKGALAWSFPEVDLSGIAAAAARVAKQNKCNGIKQKMSGSANTIKNACTTNYNKFIAISSTLDDIIHKTEEKKYSVGQLKQDVNAYKDKVTDFKKNCDQAYVYLAFTALANCQVNDPDGVIDSLKTMSSNFHSYTTKTKTSFNDVRDVYRNKIKVDLYTMGQQKYEQ